MPNISSSNALCCVSSLWLVCAACSDSVRTVEAEDHADAEVVMPGYDDEVLRPDASLEGSTRARDLTPPTGVSDWAATWLFAAAPTAFRVAGDSLYWVQAGDSGRATYIMARPVEGAAEIVQAPAPMRTAPALGVRDQKAFITTTSGNVYVWDLMQKPALLLSTLAQTASEILMEGRQLFVISTTGYYRIPPDAAGAAVESAIGSHPVEGPDGLYWIETASGRLMRYVAGVSTPVGVELDGPLGAVARRAEQLLLIAGGALLEFSERSGLMRLAEIQGDGPMWADDTHVYWIDVRTSGAVLRAERGTGTIETVFAPKPGSVLRCFAVWKDGVIVSGRDEEGHAGFWWLHPNESG